MRSHQQRPSTFTLDDPSAGVEEEDNHAPLQTYTLGEEVARGGMGRIVAAHDPRLDRPVAVKQLLGDSPSLRARFAREARITARLQHPSIVPVYEAGHDEAGRPFYAMKLIDGTSLGEASVNATGLGERLGLLPALTAVCEAIAFAHARQIIHRDLKPDNVLVGDFGETLVIDWGLAKELGTPDLPNGEIAGLQPAGVTVAGTLMGTPSYMAPELAAGAAADTRSDVYALGAMLYAVLCGREPYNTTSAMETLELVGAGPPPPMKVGIPLDLRAIVACAMARDPAERLTAQELAIELRRFQTGQLVRSREYSARHLVLRWARRNRAVLTVVSASVGLMVLGAGYAFARIVEARNEALQRRDAAETFVQVVVEELTNELEPVGRLMLLDTLAGSVGDYYKELGSLTPDEARTHEATALATVGRVRLSQGDPDGALEAYQAALTIREALTANDPSTQPLVAESHTDLSEAYFQLGRNEEALREAREAGSVAESIDDGSVPAGLRIAAARWREGKVYSRSGQMNQAIAAFEAASQRLPNSSSDPHVQRLQASIAEDAGRAHWELAEFTPALRRADEARGHAEAALKDDPASVPWRHRLSTAQRLAAHILVDSGHPAQSLLRVDASEALLRELVDWDPGNAAWRKQLADLLALRMYVEAVLGHPDDILLPIQAEILSIYDGLLADGQGSPSERAGATLARSNLASLLRSQQLDQGEVGTPDAYALLLEVLDERAEQLAAQPENFQLVTLTSQSWRMLGSWYRTDGRFQDALAAYQHALTVADSLPVQEGSRHRWHLHRLEIHGPLATIRHQLGHRDEAIRSADAALAHLAEISVEGVPDVVREPLLPELSALLEALDYHPPGAALLAEAGPP